MFVTRNSQALWLGQRKENKLPGTKRENVEGGVFFQYNIIISSILKLCNAYHFFVADVLVTLIMLVRFCKLG